MSDLEDDNEPIEMVDESQEAAEDDTQVESDAPEAEESQEDTAEEAQEETQEQTEESEDESQDTSEEDAEAIKARNAEYARARIAEREARRQQEAALLQAQQEYVGEAESAADKLVRQIEMERYNQAVQTNENRIMTEFERIKADPDMAILNNESKDFRPDLFQEFTEMFEKAYVQVDEWGNVVGVNASLYEKAKKWAGLWGKEAKVNQAKGHKTAQQNLAKSEPASSHKKPTEKDPLMEMLLSD